MSTPLGKVAATLDTLVSSASTPLSKAATTSHRQSGGV